MPEAPDVATVSFVVPGGGWFRGGISIDDIDAGYILACCSTPIGRVEVAV